ncbi:MAG: hypothetical protein VYB44_03650 [Bacteroidota bacterium]|nr:hypothetical protein [Bacteroidota bacterium]
MKTRLLFLALICLGCGKHKTMEAPYANSPVFNHEWAMQSLWEDGQAEVAQYHAQRRVYGKTRNFEYTYITVKEEFNKAYNVKTDDYSRTDLFSVMKVNKFARFETDNYPYHYLTSLFYKRAKPEQLHKITHTGQEWCGNTFKQFTLSPTGYQYDYNSYFDGFGDGQSFLEGADLIWEDQLSYLLRALRFEDGLTFEKQVVESQVNTKTFEPKVYRAHFQVVDGDSLWQVNVQLDKKKKNTYSFSKEYPNIMLSKIGWDGFNLTLKSVSRYKYWQ